MYYDESTQLWYSGEDDRRQLTAEEFEVERRNDALLKGRDIVWGITMTVITVVFFTLLLIMGLNSLKFDERHRWTQIEQQAKEQAYREQMLEKYRGVQ